MKKQKEVVKKIKELALLFGIILLTIAIPFIVGKYGFRETKLVVKNECKESPKESVEDVVYRVAHEEELDWLMVVRIIDCESRWDKYFNEKMKDGSRDKGLMAFNSKYYPNVSADCVFDPECSIRTFAEEVRSGNLGNWACAKVLGYTK